MPRLLETLLQLAPWVIVLVALLAAGIFVVAKLRKLTRETEKNSAGENGLELERLLSEGKLSRSEYQAIKQRLQKDTSLVRTSKMEKQQTPPDHT